VSIIPTKDVSVWEFFQSNTRRIKHLKVTDNAFIDMVKHLDGTTLDELTKKYGGNIPVEKFINYLYDNCLIEDYDIALKINAHPFNRVINFISDYLPTHEAIQQFKKIQNSHVVIIGCGAIGSWASQLLCQNGVAHFTLCDPDVVKHGNLNRSLYFYNDIGKKKIISLKNILEKININTKITCVDSFITCERDVHELLRLSDGTADLVINCSDFPNVDKTSEFISKACMKMRIPHIISGGYNLHLSLIGPTIVPGKTPCFHCIQKGLEKEVPVDFTNTRKLYREKRNIGNLAPLAGISASFVAFESLRVLIASNKMLPQMMGKRGEFNFLTSKLNFSEYPKLINCEFCNSITNANA
jgi:molybdopterin/thiamine biosynthesis adenylyltransferase